MLATASYEQRRENLGRGMEMKTKIKSTEDNRCTIEYDCAHTGERIVQEFWTPTGGGCVYEIDDRHPGTLGTQVCDRLSTRGNTLHRSANRPLVDIIRREYRAMRRDEARREV